MIAAHHGIAEPRRYFDFLMGFTYGANLRPDPAVFSTIGTDPETGLMTAAPCLGLSRQYFFTDDPVLYLDALRAPRHRPSHPHTPGHERSLRPSRGAPPQRGAGGLRSPGLLLLRAHLPAAIERQAAEVERCGQHFDPAQIQLGLEVGVATRPDNALHLREAFPEQPGLLEAASLFDQAAHCYHAALEASRQGIASQATTTEVARWLRQAAAAERAAGHIFLAVARRSAAGSLQGAPPSPEKHRAGQ